MIHVINILIKVISSIILSVCAIPLVGVSIILWDSYYFEQIDFLGERIWENKNNK